MVRWRLGMLCLALLAIGAGLYHQPFGFVKKYQYNEVAIRGAIDTTERPTQCYLPVVYNEHWNPPMPPQRPTPIGTGEVRPTLTPTMTEIPKPTPTNTPRPTRTRLPWPEGDVPAEVPYNVWLGILNRTRWLRDVEPWEAVYDDKLAIIAGNSNYGAQLSPIVIWETEEGTYRGMEVCDGLLIETPDGHVWVLKGYYGPIIGTGD